MTLLVTLCRQIVLMGNLLFICACHREQHGPHETNTQTNKQTTTNADPCTAATRYAVKLCIDEGQGTYWEGLWDECFNLGVQTIWDPANGSIQMISKWQLCQVGFQWLSIDNYCPVPTHQWSVSYDATYWVGEIEFAPNECLAEGIPNCYELQLLGAGCPY